MRVSGSLRRMMTSLGVWGADDFHMGDGDCWGEGRMIKDRVISKPQVLFSLAL